jgi:hypothetical protein
MPKAHIYQLANGKWKHRKSLAEFADYIGAATDYRFCCAWEN